MINEKKKKKKEKIIVGVTHFWTCFILRVQTVFLVCEPSIWLDSWKVRAYAIWVDLSFIP